MNNVKHFSSKRRAVSWGTRNHAGKFRVEPVMVKGLGVDILKPMWKVTYNGFYGSWC